MREKKAFSRFHENNSGMDSAQQRFVSPPHSAKKSRFHKGLQVCQNRGRVDEGEP